MKNETMSVHRALAELKLLDHRIEKQIHTAKFAGTKKVSGKTIGSMLPENFKKRSSESLQSIMDLMKRKEAVKAAIVKSNAETVVVVAKKEMTVAEAIDKKNTIHMLQNLIEALKQTYKENHEMVEAHNEELSGQALKYFAEITADKDRLNDNAFKALLEAYKAERELEVIEGFDVRKEYEKLEYNLDEFMTNVDFILSESNTETKINIAY